MNLYCIKITAVNLHPSADSINIAAGFFSPTPFSLKAYATLDSWLRRISFALALIQMVQLHDIRHASPRCLIFSFRCFDVTQTSLMPAPSGF